MYLSLFQAHFLVNPQPYTALHWNKTLKILGLIFLLLVFLVPASFAQNTKGDKPQTGSGPRRENRFNVSQKKKIKGKKSYNRAQGRRSSKASKAQSSQSSKIYSQKGPFVNRSSRTSKDQKSNLKASTSQSRVSARSTSSQTRNVYPQRGAFVNNPSSKPPGRPRITSNKSTVKRINTQNKSISSKNVYPKRSPYVNNPSKIPGNKPLKIASNKSKIRSSSKTKSISASNVYKQFARNANNVSRPRKERPYIVKNYSPGYRRVKTPPKDSQQKMRANTTPHYGVRSISGQRKNVFSQKNPFVHNPSQTKPRKQKTVSNKQVTKLNLGSSRAVPTGKGKKRRGVVSASRPYISRRSINAFAGFWNKKPKGEKAYTSGDLAGKPLLKKNFETKFPTRINPTAHPYKPKVKIGDQPYSGQRKGGYKSATRPGKAWSGDIAGRKIRGRNLSSKKTTMPGVSVFPPKKTKQKIGDTPYRGTIPGGGYKSATGLVKKSTGPISGKTYGAGATRIGSYSGTLKGRRAAKGGGSISGQRWNNEGQPLIGAAPLRRNIGYALFAGRKKTRVAPKGGGSVSGKFSNNQPLTGKLPSSTTIQMGRFSGRTKAQQPLKGGGSVSGTIWNNKNSPLQGKAPGIGANRVGSFQGNLKVSKRTPGKEANGLYPAKYRRLNAMSDQGEEYTGHIKVNKKEPSKAVGGIAPIRYKSLTPPMNDQGEEFTGFIKLPRFKKGYIKNPNASEASLKKARPDKTTYEVNGLQIKVKQQSYGTKPKAAEGSLKGIVASKSSIRASKYTKVLKLNYDNIHNPSSAKEALKTREPGKAFARESDYQGNIKMKKFDLFGKKDLHPDAQFVKTNKNNVDSERSLLTNFKLFWAKMFGKEDTQPSNLKEKYKKPRYAKDEGQLWYNKHNSTPGGSNSLRNSKVEKD